MATFSNSIILGFSADERLVAEGREVGDGLPHVALVLRREGGEEVPVRLLGTSSHPKGYLTILVYLLIPRFRNTIIVCTGPYLQASSKHPAHLHRHVAYDREGVPVRAPARDIHGLLQQRKPIPRAWHAALVGAARAKGEDLIQGTLSVSTFFRRDCHVPSGTSATESVLHTRL